MKSYINHILAALLVVLLAVQPTMAGPSTSVTYGPASATRSGIVTTAAQDFAGPKTFTGNLVFSANAGKAGATARLHLPAGTATASNAPLKLTQGTLLETAENGAVEFDTSGYLYFTGSGTTRDRVFTGVTGAAALDFPSIAAGAAASLTLTVTGAANGQSVVPAFPPSLTEGLVGTMFVSAASTVTVRLANNTASPIDYGSATFGAIVLR